MEERWDSNTSKLLIRNIYTFFARELLVQTTMGSLNFGESLSSWLSRLVAPPSPPSVSKTQQRAVCSVLVLHPLEWVINHLLLAPTASGQRPRLETLTAPISPKKGFYKTLGEKDSCLSVACRKPPKIDKDTTVLHPKAHYNKHPIPFSPSDIGGKKISFDRRRRFLL